MLARFGSDHLSYVKIEVNATNFRMEFSWRLFWVWCVHVAKELDWIICILLRAHYAKSSRFFVMFFSTYLKWTL